MVKNSLKNQLLTVSLNQLCHFFNLTFYLLGLCNEMPWMFYDLVSCIKEYYKKVEVIYSQVDTFRKGKYYFLGLNPGNYPKDTCPFSEYATIKTHLDGFLNNQNIPDYYEIALGNMKDSVKEIFEECLNCQLEKLFTTNLIFRQTKNADELKQYLEEASSCWPVHELALKK